ncbi:MAG TPA: YlmC/YmxH family sporulation protein [Firmicutes bacterium]|jgi:YlmC/YmxH family sporulation protein|nr:YlmC/YmxH family sporulation protein [Bacillota bacterium]
MRINDLRDRDVVNVNDGKRLGIIHDLDIDIESGNIKAIIIPGGGGLMGVLGRRQDLVIPWVKIVKVGVDTILVDLPLE